MHLLIKYLRIPKNTEHYYTNVCRRFFIKGSPFILFNPEYQSIKIICGIVNAAKPINVALIIPVSKVMVRNTYAPIAISTMLTTAIIISDR